MSDFVSITRKTCLVLILASFFLPIAKGCSKIEIPYESDITVMGEARNKIDQPLISWDVKNPKKRYAWDILELVDSTHSPLFILALCYLWPLPFLVIAKPPGPIGSLMYHGMEMICSACGTYFIILVITFVGTIEKGGALYLLSASIYFIIAFLQSISKIFHRVMNLKTMKNG